MRFPRRIWVWPAKVFSLALAYFISGKLGLSLAVPPSYATAIWPPSGIALVSLLQFGADCWPGVWLGSFCVNVGLGFDASSLEATLKSIAVAASLGMGAAIQALAGGWLVRRFVGWPAALIRNREIFSFMALGGPAGCLVAATWGVGTLWLAGILPARAMFINWSTWWVGDTLGVWLFGTLILIAFGSPREIWQKRWRSVAFPLAVCFALACAVFWLLQRSEDARRRSAFIGRAKEQVSQFVLAVRADEAILCNLASFFEASAEVSPEQFSLYAKEALKLRGGIEALSWVPREPEDHRAQFEKAAQRNGLPNFQLTDLVGGEIVPAARREEHFPLFYIEPDAARYLQIGFDMASDPARLAAFRHARDAGTVGATIPLPLGQANSTGVILVAPVYERGADSESLHPARDGESDPPANLVALRRQRLRGFVTGVFRMDHIVLYALDDSFLEDMQLRINDVTDAATPRSVFASEPGLGRPAPYLARQVWSTAIQIGGRTWQLEFLPTLAYLGGDQSMLGWSVLAAAFLFTSLVVSVLLVITGGTALVEATVAERTAELIALNKELENQTKKLESQAADAERITQSLRESKKVLRSFFDTAPMLMGVAELAPGEEDIRHISDNATSAAFAGSTVEAIQGHYSSEIGMSPEKIRLWTRHYRESERDRKPVHFEYGLENGKGEQKALSVTVYFIGISENGNSRFSYVAEDITESKRAADAQKRLVSITEATTDFVGIADVNGYAVYLNRAGREMLGLKADADITQSKIVNFHPAWAAELLQREAIPAAIREGSWTGETALSARNGHEIPVSQVVTSHKNEKGVVQFISMVSRDMSERKVTEKKIRASLAEKEVLLKEIHHRVKNNMQIVSSLLQLQSGYISDPPTVEIFRECCERIKSMALIHEKLYSSDSLARVDFPDYLRSLLSMLFAAISRPGIRFELHVDRVALGLDTAIPLGLITNELVSNCLKHGFNGRAEGVVRVKLVRGSSQELTLVVSDNGTGVHEEIDIETSPSLGLRLVGILTRQIGGELSLHRNRGAEFRVTFPTNANS